LKAAGKLARLAIRQPGTVANASSTRVHCPSAVDLELNDVFARFTLRSGEEYDDRAIQQRPRVRVDDAEPSLPVRRPADMLAITPHRRAGNADHGDTVSRSAQSENGRLTAMGFAYA
jgi:hypothetical protein